MSSISSLSSPTRSILSLIPPVETLVGFFIVRTKQQNILKKVYFLVELLTYYTDICILYVRWQIAFCPFTTETTGGHMKAFTLLSAFVLILLGVSGCTEQKVNHSTLPDILAELATDANADVRLVVVHNDYIPSEVLTDLATDEDWRVREAVATHDRTPPDVLATMAADEDWRVRFAVAAHDRTPPDVLADLATDANADVRFVLVHNDRTSPDILADLATDTDTGVRMAVAANSRTPPDVLAALATDMDTDVRLVVTAHDRTPSQIRVHREIE